MFALEYRFAGRHQVDHEQGREKRRIFIVKYEHIKADDATRECPLERG